MTDLASSGLNVLANNNIERISWENVDHDWKNRISRGILPQTHPEALIIPETVDKLSLVMAEAAEMEVTVLPCGNGSKLSWGTLISSPQWVVSTQKLNRVIDHAVGDLTITVEAGMKLKDLQQIVNGYGQFLPLDPAYPDLVTVGGMVATADSGQWRQRYGGVRDLVLGLSFVRWDGKIAKAGGKVVKNVADMT